MLCSRICWEDNDSQIVTMPVEILKFGTMWRIKFSVWWHIDIKQLCDSNKTGTACVILV